MDHGIKHPEWMVPAHYYEDMRRWAKASTSLLVLAVFCVIASVYLTYQRGEALVHCQNQLKVLKVTQ